MEDIIYDADIDMDKLTAQANSKTHPVSVKEVSGVLRDETGKFLPGTANPRVAKKVHNLDKILQRKLGDDLERVLQKLAEIALYDPDMKILHYDPESGESKLKNRKFHFYNAQAQMQALTLLCKYYYGNPRKEIQIDQTVDIKIEKKVADLTKLINDNQERLKLINGGKG